MQSHYCTTRRLWPAAWAGSSLIRQPGISNSFKILILMQSLVWIPDQHSTPEKELPSSNHPLTLSVPLSLPRPLSLPLHISLPLHLILPLHLCLLLHLSTYTPVSTSTSLTFSTSLFTSTSLSTSTFLSSSTYLLFYISLSVPLFLPLHLSLPLHICFFYKILKRCLFTGAIPLLHDTETLACCLGRFVSH